MALLFFNLGARWGWVDNTTLRPTLTRGITRHLLYRRLGNRQSRDGRVWEISPPPGFDLRIVQPVARRHTDRVILRGTAMKT
jgi:hypothetical protein